MYPPLGLEEDPSHDVVGACHDVVDAFEAGLQIAACIAALKKLDSHIAAGYTLVGVPSEGDEIFWNNHLRALQLHHIEIALWFTVPDSITRLAQELREYHLQLTAVPARSEMQTHTRRKLIELIQSLLEEIKLLRDWAIEREARFAYFSRC